MPTALIRRILIEWTGKLSILWLLSTNCLGNFELQPWLDSMSSIVESYDAFTKRVESQKSLGRSIVSASPSDEALIQCELVDGKDGSNENCQLNSDQVLFQREEAILDSLASRLLVEEYLPYDIDIRETLWFKDYRHLEIGVKPLLVSESRSTDAIVEIPWLATILSHNWSSTTELFDGMIAQSETWTNCAIDQSLALIAVHGRNVKRNVAKMSTSMTHLFGNWVMPNEIEVSQEEYTALRIQEWIDMQACPKRHSVLIQSTWYQFKSLEPVSSRSFENVANSSPNQIPMAQR
ncbi:MAG: hypothetical protein SGI77_03495 [Pirellulaceae bacterium]|nr:hypothetical protein [Pirellulaceae bacterium]